MDSLCGDEGTHTQNGVAKVVARVPSRGHGGQLSVSRILELDVESQPGRRVLERLTQRGNPACILA